MAGGMLPGRSGRSLSDRAANSGVPPTSSPDGPADAPRPSSAPAPERQPGGHPAGERGEGRHCWVHDPPEARGTWPGLLVEWRQRDGGWQGRVTYTVAGPHGPALIEAWLPATRLEPR